MTESQQGERTAESQPDGQKPPFTARQWFLVMLGGGLVWFCGTALADAPNAAALGRVVVVFGLLGLIWRLLRNR